MNVLEMKTKQALLVPFLGVEHRIEFSFRAVAAIEEDLGRKMTTLPDWFRITTKEIPVILQHGFVGLEGEEAAKLAASICDNQGPEGIERIIDAMCAVAFPEQVARFKAELEKIQNKGKGDASPNA